MARILETFRNHFLATFMVALAILVNSVSALAASNQNLVYQGRIIRPDGTAVNSGTVTFSLAVYSSSPSRCLLYSESQTLNMAGSQGMFSLQLGSGTRTDGGAHPFNKTFVNAGSLSGLTCASGTSYTPGASDDRELAVSFNDQGTVVQLSAMPIKSVPYALQAQEISGYGINDLVKVHPTTGSPTTFTTAEMAKIRGIGAAACANNEILKWNGTAWICSPDATGGAPADAAYGSSNKGIVAFDTDAATSGITVASGVAKLSSTGVTAATYGSATAVPTIAIDAQGRITGATATTIALPVSQLTQSGASNGQVLKWNGSAWAPAADVGVTADASYAAKGVVQFDTDAETSGVSVTSGVAKVNTGVGANQIVKLDGSGKLPAVDGSALTNLTATSYSGVLPVANGGTNSNTALNNNRLMVSSGGKIVEAAAMNDGQLMIGSTGAAPVVATLGSSNGITVTGGAGSLSIGSNATSANTVSAIVARDASGNFAAGAVTNTSNILKGGTSGQITMTVPGTVTPYTLTWPSGVGSAGSFLTTDASGNLSWGSPAAIADSSYAAKGAVQFDTDAATSGVSVTSGVAKVNAGTGANQIVQLDSSSKLPAVDGSLLTNLSAGNIASGVLPIARGGTNNGSLAVTAGGILYMDGTRSQTTAAGTSGQALLSAGAGAPAFGNLSVPAGGTGTTSFAANSLVMANGTGSALTGMTCSLGQILKWDGTAWSCSTGAGAIADAAYTSSNKGVVAFETDAATSGVSVTSGVARVNTGTNANQIVKLDGSAKLPAVDGSALTNVTASAYSGVLPIANGGTNSSTALNNNKVMVSSGGAIVEGSGHGSANTASTFVTRDASGNFAAGAVTNTSNILKATTGALTMTVPGTVTDYTLTWPSGVGSAGSFLTTDASGNLSWGSPAAIADASYAAKGAVQGLTNAATSGLIFNSGVISVNSGTAANQIVKLDASAKLPAVDGSDLTNLSAGNISTGTLPVARGGTGAATLTSNGVLLGNGTSAVTATAAGAAYSVLRVPSGGGAPVFGSIDLSQSAAVTGVLPAGSGGTGQSSYTAGDMLYASGATATSKLGIGASGTILTSTGSAPQWSTIGSLGFFVNGGNTFTGTAVLGSNSNHNLEIETNGTTRVVIENDGDVGVGATSPSEKFEVGGIAKVATLRVGSNVTEKSFQIDFPNGVANQKVDLSLGNAATTASFVISLSSSYFGELAVGVLEKTFVLSASAGGTINHQEAYYSKAIGPVADRFAISDVTWDAVNSVYRVQIVHRTSVNNPIYVSLKALHSETNTVFKNASLGSIYTTDATVFAKPQMHFLGNLGFGVTDPSSILDLSGAITQRGMAAPTVSPTGQGRIYFDSTSNKFRISQNGGAYVDLVPGATADASYSTKGLVQGLTDAATSGLVFNSGVISVNAGTSANQIVKLNGSAQLPAVDGSLLTNLSAANVTAGTLPVSRGGTGATTLTSNAVLLGNGTSAVSATAAGTANQVLRIPSGGGAPVFGSIDLSQSAAVTGTLGASNGGTGQSAYTTGDMLYATSASAVSKLGIGASGTILTSTGSAPQWSSISSLGFFVDGGNTVTAAAKLGTNSAHNLEIETGGTTKMTVESGGDVGIGIANPAYRLDVNTSPTLVAHNFYDVARFSESGTGHGVGIGYIANSGATGVRAGNIAAIGTGVNLALGTSNYGEAITVRDSNGSVGIGNTNPTYRLDLNRSDIAANTTYPLARIAHSTTGSGVMLGYIANSAGNDASHGYVATSSAGVDLALGTSTNNKAVVIKDSNGRVGIGTASPIANLQVHGGATGYTETYFTGTNTGATATDGFTIGIQNSNSDAYLWNYENAILQFGTNNAERMRINATGEVGIGTTASAGTKLEIRGTGTTNPVMKLVRATGHPDQALELHPGDSTTTHHYITGRSPENLKKKMMFSSLHNSGGTPGGDLGFVFRIGPDSAPVTVLNINESGYTGIGNITPASVLDIDGAFTQRGMAAPGTSPAGQGRIYFDSTANKFKVSQNGAAYVDLVGGGSSGVTGVTAGTGLLVGTTAGGTISSTGTLNINTGTGANQIVQLDGSGKLPVLDGSALTNISAANITAGTLPVGRGGTGLTAGTSGGIPYYSATNTMASSALLTQNGVVLGGGAGAAPTATAAGAAYSVLRVPSGGGAPVFGAIDLSQSAAVTGTLEIANGGTGAASLAANRLIGTNGTGSAQQVVTCSQNQVLSFDASGNYGCYNVGTIFGGFVNGGNTFTATATLGTNSAHNLEIETGGTTRMTVKSTGEVGIGTTNPGAAFHVNGASAFENSAASSAGPTFSFWKSRNYAAVQNNDELGFISFYGHNGTGLGRSAYIAAQAEGAPAGTSTPGRLTFHTTASGNADSTERMRIESNGNVGIGTNDPNTFLDIAGYKTGAVPLLKLTNSVSETWIGAIDALAPNAVAGQYVSIGLGKSLTTNDSAGLSYYHVGDGNTANRFSIGFMNNDDLFNFRADGKVGVGPKAPEARLHIGTSNIDAQTAPTSIANSYYIGVGANEWDTGSYRLIGLGYNDQGSGSHFPAYMGFQETDSNANTYGDLIFGTRNVTTDTEPSERMRIRADGKIAMGTPYMPGRLNVGHWLPGSHVDTVLFSLVDTYNNGNNGQTLNFQTYGDGVHYEGFNITNNYGPLSFGASFTGVDFEHSMVLTPDKRLGIGTQYPNGTLHLWGPGFNGSEAAIYLGDRGSAYNPYIMEYGTGDTDEMAIGASNGVRLFTSFGQVMMLTSNGRVGIGTASPGHKLHVVGTAGLSTGTAWTNTSDIRVKDIDGDYEYGLNEILKLNTVRFHYKKDNPLGLSSEHPMTGFVAQEVQKVIPDAVTTRSDGYLELNVDPIHWATVNAVQDLHGMCKMTDQQVQRLQADYQNLSRTLASVQSENVKFKQDYERIKKENEAIRKENSAIKKDLELIKKKLGL